MLAALPDVQKHNYRFHDVVNCPRTLEEASGLKSQPDLAIVTAYIQQ